MARFALFSPDWSTTRSVPPVVERPAELIDMRTSYSPGTNGPNFCTPSSLIELRPPRLKPGKCEREFPPLEAGRTERLIRPS